MKAKNWALLIGMTVLMGLAVLTFKPVPIPDEEDCLAVRGQVTKIFEAGEKDVVFLLNGMEEAFYVNRGLERGLDIGNLRGELMNKEIVIKYPKYWTPLDPRNAVRHVSKIEVEGETIFTELRD